MNEASDLHPLAKRVGAAITDKGRIDEAKKAELASSLAALGIAERDKAVAGVLGLAIEAKKAGPAAAKLIDDLCELVVAALTGQKEVEAAFDKAGLSNEIAAATGRVVQSRAPAAPTAATTPKVVAKRGLR